MDTKGEDYVEMGAVDGKDSPTVSATEERPQAPAVDNTHVVRARRLDVSIPSPQLHYTQLTRLP